MVEARTNWIALWFWHLLARLLGRPRTVGDHAGPNYSLQGLGKGCEWLSLTYLVDGPSSWAHIVILVIDAGIDGVDTSGDGHTLWQT